MSRQYGEEKRLRAANYSLTIEDVIVSTCNTAQYPIHEQFDFWRESTANAGLIERPGRYSAPFSAKTARHFTSSVAYLRHSVDSPSSLNRTSHHVSDTKLDTVAIQLRLSGQETENSINRDTLFSPGDIRITDLSQPIYSANERYDNFAFFVHKRDLVDRLPGLESLHGLTLRNSAMSQFLKSHMLSVMRALPMVSALNMEQIADVSVEMLGATLLTSIAPHSIESEVLDAPVLRAVRMYIKQRLDDPDLSPAEIAHQIGVSRAKLFRICKPYGTPMELVRLQRLRRAKQLVQLGRVQSVAELAYAVGYENRTSFGRAFRREFGFSVMEFLHACRRH